MVYLYYISCLRYTVLVGNPRYKACAPPTEVHTDSHTHPRPRSTLLARLDGISHLWLGTYHPDSMILPVDWDQVPYLSITWERNGVKRLTIGLLRAVIPSSTPQHTCNLTHAHPYTQTHTACLWVCSYTHTHTHTNTHTHTKTHTQTRSKTHVHTCTHPVPSPTLLTPPPLPPTPITHTHTQV